MADRTSRAIRRATITVAFGALFACPAAPALAAGPGARLSADLADGLSAGAPALDVLVHGDKATVDALASRYNLRVKRYLRSGAVLQVTAGQLDALRQDDTVDHLS